MQNPELNQSFIDLDVDAIEWPSKTIALSSLTVARATTREPLIVRVYPPSAVTVASWRGALAGGEPTRDGAAPQTDREVDILRRFLAPAVVECCYVRTPSGERRAFRWPELSAVDDGLFDASRLSIPDVQLIANTVLELAGVNARAEEAEPDIKFPDQRGGGMAGGVGTVEAVRGDGLRAEQPSGSAP